MWQNKKRLARLQEELGTIELFDRIHDYEPCPTHSDRFAYAVRQVRRSQIIAEIQKLRENNQKIRHHAGKSSVALLTTVVGYIIYYLLR